MSPPRKRARRTEPAVPLRPGGSRESDDELMMRCAVGDTEALAQLMARHQAAAQRYAWRIFRNHHTAEDLTQELFIKLFRNAPRYEPRGHFVTWFYRVLGNLCYDLLRKRKRRAKINSVQLDPLEAEGTELEPLARLHDEDLGLRAAEAHDSVHAAVAKLPVQCRRAIELREFEGLRYKEIAEVLDLSLNEVKVLLHRARKLLARTLAHTPVGREWRIEYGRGGAS